MFHMSRHSQVLGGVLLVAGTTIGAAMLGMPLSAGITGFFPSTALFTAVWLLMTYTAFLFLELNFYFEGDIDIITMAKETLGKSGEIACWFVYLFLLYALTTAYIAGSAPIFEHAILTASGFQIPSWVGPLPLLLIFGAFVYNGVHSVDEINRVLMAGLVICFLILTATVIWHVDPEQLLYVDMFALPLAVPIVSTSFGFHIIIPSLTYYLDHRLTVLKKVIWIGSAIPLAAYLIWNFLALGVIPLQGTHGLIDGYETGVDGAQLLAYALGATWISTIVRLMSFFAIVTSFLGVSLSLRHFLADGLNIKNNRKGRLFLVALTFLPPLVISLLDPRAFLSALEYAGGYGVVILLALFPAIMVWSARYRMGIKGPFRVGGGKPALTAVIALSALVMLIQLGIQIGVIHG